jgi:hypothetical protein
MINPHVAGGVKDAGTLAFELQPLLGRANYAENFPKSL